MQRQKQNTTQQKIFAFYPLYCRRSASVDLWVSQASRSTSQGFLDPYSHLPWFSRVHLSQPSIKYEYERSDVVDRSASLTRLWTSVPLCASALESLARRFLGGDSGRSQKGTMQTNVIDNKKCLLKLRLVGWQVCTFVAEGLHNDLK